MKIFMRTTIVALLFTCIFNVYGQAQSNRKSITVAYSEYPPYEFAIFGGEDGLTIRKVKAVAADIGIKVRFVFAPWARALYMVKAGEVDAILSLNHTKERESFLSFPKIALAKNEESLFSLRKHHVKVISKYEHLLGISIGVIEDYTYGKKFDSMDGLKKVYSRDDINLIERLRKGWIDVIVVSQKVFEYQVKKLKLDRNDFVLHPLVLNRESLSMGFSKKIPDYEALTSLFEKQLEKYSVDFDDQLLIEKHCVYGVKGCGTP